MTTQELADALSAPFDPKEIKFKPQMVKQNRCLAMAYIDARLVQDRLDEVVGVGGWQTEYRQVGDGSFECRLCIKVDGEWITKADVGSTSEQPDPGDRLKAAYSDALKRAAVAWGIGRYLYRLPSQWVDYDPVKKQIVTPPQLPAWAIPQGKAAPPAAKPAQQPAARPAPTQADPELLRIFQDKLDACRGRNEAIGIGGEIAAAKKRGELNEPQCNTLRVWMDGVLAKFPAPAKV